VKPEEIELVRRDYSANGGWETFLAYEDPRQDILVGLLRLRKVSGAAKSRQAELQGRCSIVRELHVYGTAVAVSARDATKQQHQVRPRHMPMALSSPVLWAFMCSTVLWAFMCIAVLWAFMCIAVMLLRLAPSSQSLQLIKGDEVLVASLKPAGAGQAGSKCMQG